MERIEHEVIKKVNAQGIEEIEFTWKRTYNGDQLIKTEKIMVDGTIFLVTLGNGFINQIQTYPKPNIEGIRKKIIEAMSNECQNRILAGFKSKAFDGITEKEYDCNSIDQGRINGLVLIAAMVLMGATTEVIDWKAKGEIDCYPWQPLSMVQLGMDRKKHEELHTKRNAALKKWALCEDRTVEELEGWTWDMELNS